VNLFQVLESHYTKSNAIQIKKALADQDSKLTLEEKARILQMIVQCSSSFNSLPKGPNVQSSSPGVQSFRDTMLRLMNDIDRVTGEFYVPACQQRLLYMQLARMYAPELKREQDQMERKRKERKRSRAQGVPLDPMKDSGKTAKGRVLDKIINQSTEQNTTRRRLIGYIRIGARLDYLSSKVGPWLILTFPSYTVNPCDFELPFPDVSNRFSALARPLEPSRYV
jgi:hypothetical protein